MELMSVVLFKQKTAYELRISDWSSDVCSSDLGHHGLDPYPQERRGQPARAPGRCGRLSAETVLDQRAYRRRRLPARVAWEGQGACQGGAADAPGDGALKRRRGASEIGRASGRERVCQAV